MNTSILFNLDFANNIISSCFFFFYLFIHLYHLIAAVITHIFNPIAELVILIAIPTKEAKVEMETHPVNAKLTISEIIHSIYFFSQIISYFIYLLKSKFSIHVFFSHDYIFSDTLLFC